MSPPTAIFAPVLTASATCSLTFLSEYSSIIGPEVTPSSRPSPTLILETALVNFSKNSLYILSWTKILFAQTQV